MDGGIANSSPFVWGDLRDHLFSSAARTPRLCSGVTPEPASTISGARVRYPTGLLHNNEPHEGNMTVSQSRTIASGVTHIHDSRRRVP